MRAQAEREAIVATKNLQKHSKIGFANDSQSARKELTGFAIQSELEVQRMNRELDSTMDKTRDLDKRAKVQESKQRELEQLMATSERLLKAKSAQVKEMQVKNDAYKSTDYN